MILPDHEIYDRCVRVRAPAEPLVTPYRAQNLQPASIDVTLADEFRVFVPHGEGLIDLNNPVDLTRKVETDRFVLHPGEFVLGVTEEMVNMPDDLVARIEGKSSLGRLGLIVHATAGFIDPGFRGCVTLEMTNLMRLPLVLRPGKLIAQISFHQMSSAAKQPYAGRYQGDMGVGESRYGQDALPNAHNLPFKVRLDHFTKKRYAVFPDHEQEIPPDVFIRMLSGDPYIRQTAIFDFQNPPK